MKKLLHSIGVLTAIVMTAGCALTSKADVMDVRYFTPEHVKPRLTGEGVKRAASPLEVRLGRVSSGANLRERIAYRDSAYEIGYYEDRRWTERPETFVRRELGRTLFEERGFRHAVGGVAPTLDAELVSFDEVRLPGDKRAARVQLKVVLYEDYAVLFEDTITVDRPVNGTKPKIEDVVAAMAEALDVAAEQVADRVATSLAARPVPRTEPAGSPPVR